MPEAALSTDLTRRKQVRLSLRTDLEVKAQKYEGRTYHVVKDPVSLRYYYFTEQEHFLLRMLDGKHTLEEAQESYESEFRPERLRLEEIESFGQQLLTAGLVHQDTPLAGEQLFDRRKKRRRREIMAAWTNILYIKIPFIDPDRLLDKMLPYFRWMYTAWFGLFSLGVVLAALFLVLSHFEAFREKLPSFQEFFRFQTLASMWLVLGVVKVIHEFGHGLSCKAFKGEVHEMGLLFLCLSPCLYCNVSDAWILPNKWKRIVISFAGIYVELMIAAISTFVWWNSVSQPLLHSLSLYLMVVCSISTVIFNGNPLMRYDGYYVLADWLEIPNLREQSNRYLKNLVLEHCMGVEVPPEQYMALGRRCIFVSYAVVSYIYRWVVTFGILYFISMFLKPYKLEAIGQMMTLAAIGSMAGWPLYNLGKGLHKRGRLPDMSRVRVSVSLAVLGTVLVAFFAVPLPVGRIRERALIQVQQDALRELYVNERGILERLPVRDGQLVAAGDIIAEFSNIDFENKLAEARTDYQIANVQRQAAHAEQVAMRRKDVDPTRRTQIMEDLSNAESAQEKAAKQIDLYDQSLRRLVLKAPCAGVVMGLPHKDDLGKTFEKELETPFCTIGDPTQLRALVPLGPADYRLLKEDMKAAHDAGSELTVDIRVRGRDGDIFPGRVAELPQQEAKDVPLSLTTQAGGPLAVRQGPGHTYVPQSQCFLVVVDFVETDKAIQPGAMCQVKIHCQWHSAAWWVWRALSKTFDLGLL
jgi:putative peptide zinc metalloprotease protein